MRFKTHSHRTHSLTTGDGQEVELGHGPYCENDILAEVVGDKLVVAYLVQDDNPENPMTESDGQGVLYTLPSRGWGGGSITDNAGGIYSALGCDGYGGVDIDKTFACELGIAYPGTQQPRHLCLRDIAAIQFLAKIGADHGMIAQWFYQMDMKLDEGETFDEAFQTHHDDIWRDLEDSDGVFCSEVESLATSLYHDYWQQIAGPFVVPCDYCSSNHGPGTASLSVTSWDGDPDDLPNALWVADECAIENLEASALPPGYGICWHGAVGVGGSTLHAVITKDGVEVFDAGVVPGSWRVALNWAKDQEGPLADKDLRTAAAKYAEGFCSEYESWCNGDVYGCVTETFQRTDEGGEWESIDEGGDSCWGLSGLEYARQSLKSEFFDEVIERLKKGNPDNAIAFAKAEDTEGGSCD